MNQRNSSGQDANALAAYQRVTERILGTWHANDPLERFLYRGA